MKKYVINGLFMCERLSGIHRYAIEILKRIDKIINDQNISIEILAPFDIVEAWRPKTIKLVKAEVKRTRFAKHWWMNVTLPRYASSNNATVVNLCNTGPLFNSGITCIHDINYKTNPEFFPWKKRIIPTVYYYFLTRNSKHIVTVSGYSKSRLEKYYGVSDDRITVIGNGWEHIESYEEDRTVLDKFDLSNKGYYLSIGNISPHKNLLWVINEANNNTQEKFVIIGDNVFGIATNDTPDIPENVLFVGRVPDEAVKTLMLNAKALLFPSFCEGFGIPPLEMLALGGNAIVAEVSCMPEIFGKAVAYIDPKKADYNLKDISFDGMEIFMERVLQENNWNDSAKKWMELLKRV